MPFPSFSPEPAPVPAVSWASVSDSARDCDEGACAEFRVYSDGRYSIGDATPSAERIAPEELSDLGSAIEAALEASPCAPQEPRYGAEDSEVRLRLARGGGEVMLGSRSQGDGEQAVCGAEDDGADDAVRRELLELEREYGAS